MTDTIQPPNQNFPATTGEINLTEEAMKAAPKK